MWLRLFTTAMLFGALALMVGRSVIVGPLPHKPVKRIEALHYSQRALAFTTVLIVTLVGAGVGAIKLVRIANQEYRDRAMQNMQAMIEGAIADHKRTAEKPDGS